MALLQLFEDEPEKIRQPQSDELLAQTEVANCMVGKTQQREDVTSGSKGQSFKVRNKNFVMSFKLHLVRTHNNLHNLRTL